MTSEEFGGRLAEIGFSRDDHALAWRRADGAVISVEFIDDFLALWGPKLAEEALGLWAGGAKTLRVTTLTTPDGVIPKLEIVE